MTGSLGLGLAMALVSAVCFGSNFVVIKKYDPKDGFTFQFFMCIGIWIVGVIVLIARSVFLCDKYSPCEMPFFPPLALLGGALWCIGNVATPFIVRNIGLGLGLLTWGSVQMLTGWATGYFGLFGVAKAELRHPYLNIVGVVIALCAVAIYVLVALQPHRPKWTCSSSSHDFAAHSPLLPPVSPVNVTIEEEIEQVKDDMSDMMDPNGFHPEKKKGEIVVPPSAKARAAAVFAAACAGLLYGVNMIPATAYQDTNQGFDPFHRRKDGLDLVFPQYSGIMAMSTIITAIYSIYKKNKPFVNPNLLLMGIISGIIWAIAMTCWFVANDELSFTVSFPIITSLPGIVGSLWGIFVFKEITGKPNYVILLTACSVAIAAAVVIAVSHG